MEDIFDKILSKIRELCIKYKYAIFVIIAISIGIYILDYVRQDSDVEAIAEYYKRDDNVQMENETIVVHIDGAIVKPGVYELPVNSRVNDLINMAGDVTIEAITKNINLARYLQDGEKIYIYKQGEEEIEIEGQTSSGKININSATKEQLMTLPGIGEATATKIMEYIKAHGKLKNIEDIKNISGIGESKFANIEDLIDVK